MAVYFMPEVNLSYAIYNGDISHISEIPAKGGILNDCLCPNCGEVVIPKRGAILSHHFSHKPSSNCGASTASETALHMYAKKIIANMKSVVLPDLRVSGDVLFSSRDAYVASSAIEHRHDSGFISDAVLHTDIGEIIVECVVTHAPCPETVEKMNDSRCACVVVDMSGWPRSLTPSEIHIRLLSGYGWKWITHPNIETAKRKREIEKAITDSLTIQVTSSTSTRFIATVDGRNVNCIMPGDVSVDDAMRSLCCRFGAERISNVTRA